MQRVARSIVPSVNREGYGEAEAKETVMSDSAVSSSDAAPAPRRRRGGRRVVRGAGAAGAAVELTVQEHAAPLFEEPRVPVAAHDEERDEQPPRPPRQSTRRRAASRDTERDDERAVAPDAGQDGMPDGGQGEPDARASRPSRADNADDEPADDKPARRTRTRTRRTAAASSDDVFMAPDESVRRRPSRAATRAEAGADEPGRGRAADAADAADAPAAAQATEPVRAPRPMTSLLFQEPVLPAITSRSHDDDRDERDERDAPQERTSRRSRRAAATDERARDERARDGRDGRDEEDVERPTRRSRRRRAGADAPVEAVTEDRAPREPQDAADEERDPAESGRSRRSRRLNAQERRAAAEVEQIEEDLEYDDITYAPITDEDLSEGPTRSRRRRRRGGRDAEREAERESVESAEPDDAVADAAPRRRHDDDEEESNVTRRRRRRRAKSGEDREDEAPRRSRKQQYIDEITDIEGSTRLEAKKQRRRDNRRERSRQAQLMEQDFLARRENVERLMVVRQRGRHTQISVIEDNVLVEHYVSDIQEVATVGNVYLGRVQNVLPSMEAAFVDIGQSRNGVLYAGEVNWDAARLEGQPRRIELAFKSGDPVLVQVTKDPIGHKGARLTSQVTLAGRFLVLVPSGGMTGVSRKLSERERSRLKGIISKIAPKDMGVIIRTAAEGASEEAITKDLENLVRQWERITARREEFLHGRRPKLLQGEPDVAIRVVRDIFNDDFKQMIVEGDAVYGRIEEYLDTMAPDLRDKLERWDPAEHEGRDVFDRWQIDAQLRKGMERQVYLPSGGSIVIDRTEAMTTIDVNTGRFIGKGKSLEETVTRCNLEAAEEIARQLRLRDIGGMVMIDFVDMVMPANRDLVLRRLVECLARDRTKHQVAEVTSLGLVQMTRKRIGQGLVEAFSEECPTCKGRGFILHDEPTVNGDYDDPYALKGGDPFLKTNKHGRGTDVQVPQGSSAAVKAKLAQIAAAAVAANGPDDE